MLAVLQPGCQSRALRLGLWNRWRDPNNGNAVSAGIEDQTRQALANCESILQATGARLVRPLRSGSSVAAIPLSMSSAAGALTALSSFEMAPPPDGGAVARGLHLRALQLTESSLIGFLEMPRRGFGASFSQGPAATQSTGPVASRRLSADLVLGGVEVRVVTSDFPFTVSVILGDSDGDIRGRRLHLRAVCKCDFHFPTGVRVEDYALKVVACDIAELYRGDRPVVEAGRSVPVDICQIRLLCHPAFLVERALVRLQLTEHELPVERVNLILVGRPPSVDVPSATVEGGVDVRAARPGEIVSLAAKL